MHWLQETRTEYFEFRFESWDLTAFSFYEESGFWNYRFGNIRHHNFSRMTLNIACKIFMFYWWIVLDWILICMSKTCNIVFIIWITSTRKTTITRNFDIYVEYDVPSRIHFVPSWKKVSVIRTDSNKISSTITGLCLYHIDQWWLLLSRRKKKQMI